jgi:hypothetical protein
MEEHATDVSQAMKVLLRGASEPDGLLEQTRQSITIASSDSVGGGESS